VKDSLSTMETTAVSSDEPASLQDVFGMFGGLMAALAPPEDAEAIRQGMDELGTVLGSLGESVAQTAVEASHTIPTKDRKQLYEWVPMQGYDMPDNALPAAKDHSSEFNVYVARAEFEGHIRSGKVHADYKKVYIALDGEEKEIIGEPYEVLCVHEDANVEWIECENGDVPVGAVVGSVVNGKKEFVGRGPTSDQISPGRIVPDDGCMYTPYGGQDKILTKYEALAIKNGNPIYEWVPVDSWELPENALPASKDHSSTYNVFLARVKLDGKLRFGKAHIGYKAVFVPDIDGEKEVYEEPFEVLCVDPEATVEWVDLEDGKVPAGAVVGSIVDGKIEFIGRGNTWGTYSPGKIVPADKCMYAPYGGKCKVLTKYQALVIQ